MSGARVELAHAPSYKRDVTKKSGNIFRVGIFLDFVWLTIRTMHPHGASVRRARRNRIDPHGGEIERLAAGSTVAGPAWWLYSNRARVVDACRLNRAVVPLCLFFSSPCLFWLRRDRCWWPQAACALLLKLPPDHWGSIAATRLKALTQLQSQYNRFAGRGQSQSQSQSPPKSPQHHELQLPGTRREPFNFTPMGVNPISSGSPHVRPMGRTCGEPDEIKKIPIRNIYTLFFLSRPPADGRPRRRAGALQVCPRCDALGAGGTGGDALGERGASGRGEPRSGDDPLLHTTPNCHVKKGYPNTGGVNNALSANRYVKKGYPTVATLTQMA